MREFGKPHYNPTLQIRVSDAAQKNLWRSALITIGQMLFQKEAIQLRVMIVIPENIENQTLVIPADHKIATVWSSSLRDQVLSLLETVEFLKIGLWYWGASIGTAKLTLVLVVIDNVRELEPVVQGIAKICGLHGLAVEIIEGNIIGALEESRLAASEDYRKYINKIPMGFSLGIEK